MERSQHAAGPIAEAEHAESAERRYTALIGLAQGAAVSHDWSELARSIAQALDNGAGAAVRILGLTSDGHQDLGGWPAGHSFPEIQQLDLTRAAREVVATGGPEGTALVGLHADGLTLGVLQAEGDADTELLAAVAPLVACRFSVLASQGVGDVLFAPEPVEQASDESTVISDFARYAKRRLDHDRLSVYLTSPDGRAFERFAVATSPIVPGEGVLIPIRGRRLEAHRPQQRAARLQRHRGRPPHRGARGSRHRPGRLPRAVERAPAQAGPRLRGPQLRQPRARLLPPGGRPGRPGDRGPDRDLRREPAASAPDAGARPPGGKRGRASPTVPRRVPHGRAGGAGDRGDRVRPRAAARVRQHGERIRPQDPQARRGRARGHAPRRDRHGPRGLRTPRPGGDRAHLPGAVQRPRRPQGRVRAAGRHRGHPGRHPAGCLPDPPGGPDERPPALGGLHGPGQAGDRPRPEADRRGRWQRVRRRRGRPRRRAGAPPHAGQDPGAGRVLDDRQQPRQRHLPEADGAGRQRSSRGRHRPSRTSRPGPRRRAACG